ncbi:MAG: PP2C family protein-serine/threonine phosphatase [Capsulimonadaceae bacterium]
MLMLPAPDRADTDTGAGSFGLMPAAPGCADFRVMPAAPGCDDIDDHDLLVAPTPAEKAEGVGVDLVPSDDEPIDPRSHVEMDISGKFAAVSDCGTKHPDNQDSVGLSAVEILVSPIDVPPIYIAVICDGVSCSDSGASASLVAVDSAVALLEKTFTRYPDANPREQLERAINTAQEAVCSIPHLPDSMMDPPATTIVAAVVVDGVATIGWVGDSRAYWIRSDGYGLLTRDHSWVNAMIDAGKMTEEQAVESPNRNALFHCLCSAEEVPLKSSFTTFAMTPGTRLVLCTDGFWNYAPRAQDVARLVRQTPPGNALKTAKHLVNYAIVGGGHDNISVAIIGL